MVTTELKIKKRYSIEGQESDISEISGIYTVFTKHNNTPQKTTIGGLEKKTFVAIQPTTGTGSVGIPIIYEQTENGGLIPTTPKHYKSLQKELEQLGIPYLN